MIQNRSVRTRSALIPAAIALLLASTDAGAQEAPIDTVPVYHLRPITVDARRSPALRADLPQQVDVVTRQDVERTAAEDVAGVLKRNANVDVIEFPALLSGVSVRGFRPQYSGINPRTVILVDGRPAGATNLATLDLGGVERIEVLKGPASALYGSSAMGGAVNVVSRRTDGPVSGRFSTSYGSFGTYRAAASAGGNLGAALDFDLHLAIAGRRDGFTTGGSRAFGDGPITKVHADGRHSELAESVRDTLLRHSEFDTRSGGLRLGYTPTEGVRVEGRIDHFRGDEIQNPGDVNVTAYSTRSLNDLARTSGDLSVTLDRGVHTLRFRTYGSREATSYYDSADDPEYISSRSPVRWRGVQLQDVARFGGHVLTTGLDLSASATASEVFSAPGVQASPYSADAEVRSAAAFAEGRLDLLGDGRLHATLGGRIDRVAFEIMDATLADGSEVTGNVEHSTVFNPSGGLVFQPGGGVRVHASGGRSFVTPDAFNVAGYSQQSVGAGAVVVTRGNPDLRPERGTSWDLGMGIVRPTVGIDADVTYFSTRVTDRIAAVPGTIDDLVLTPAGDTVRAVTTYANADRGRIEGVEVAAGYDLGAMRGYPYSLRLFASATRMLRARETTGDRTTDIRNVADLTAVGGIEFDDLERLNGRLSVRYVGERLDTDFVDFMDPGDVRYPEFLVVDLSAGLRIGAGARLTGEIANLLDEHYYEVRGYTMPGRSLRVGLSLDW